jgi:RNA polymerase sigma factor (TIGR02999 family)
VARDPDPAPPSTTRDLAVSDAPAPQAPAVDATALAGADVVYDELRRLARRYVQRERARSLQATELVHEAYLRLARDHPELESRSHFVALAAIAMRRLLVERARARGAAKRGGGQALVTLDEGLVAGAGRPVDLVALDAALEALARHDAAKARIVELRYFGGLSVEETAEVMGSSPATVKRHWAMARAWLLRELTGAPPAS